MTRMTLRKRYSVLLLLVLLAPACRDRTRVTPSEVVIAHSRSAPSDPSDSAWTSAPEHRARLILQDLVEPRQMKVTTAEVRVRAVTNGTEVSFRLEWDDPSADNVTSPGQFTDACAIQLPAVAAGSAPAPQMGEPAGPVEITFWRASWQAIVEGRGSSIRELHPHAAIDHYPFQAPSLPEGSPEQKEMESRYAPAHALGNKMAGPRETPVEDLIAQGPGTLQPASRSASTGWGQRTKTGWSVVITRPLPAGLTPQNRSQIAFAVWEGAEQEVGSRKMRTGWIPLALEEQS
jgi:DMSO reductase family type II enzyme heme b subunit